MENNVATVCGKTSCQCARIMANFEESKTPFFFASNNFTPLRGPKLSDQFVRKHGHEIRKEVTLEAAGKIFAVELQVIDKCIVRLGLGWESFILVTKVQTEDLLFFTLEGHSRFAVTVVRGHSRRKEVAAEVEPQKRKRKHGDVTDVVLEEGTSQSWHHATEEPKRPNSKRLRRRSPCHRKSGSRVKSKGDSSKPPNPVVELSSDSEPSDPGTKYVTFISSEDPFQMYMSLNSGDSTAESDEGSNFEDESDFNDFNGREL